VRQDALVPEIPICQRPHGLVRPIMGAHIGVAGRPAITEIEELALGTTVLAVDDTGWAERSVSMAVWTFDVFLFPHKIITSKMRANDGAMTSFCVKNQLS